MGYPVEGPIPRFRRILQVLAPPRRPLEPRDTGANPPLALTDGYFRNSARAGRKAGIFLTQRAKSGPQVPRSVPTEAMIEAIGRQPEGFEHRCFGPAHGWAILFL